MIIIPTIFAQFLAMTLLVNAESEKKCEPPTVINCTQCQKPENQSSATDNGEEKSCHPPVSKKIFYNSTTNECDEVKSDQCVNNDANLYINKEACEAICIKGTNSGNETNNGTKPRERRESGEYHSDEKAHEQDHRDDHGGNEFDHGGNRRDHNNTNTSGDRNRGDGDSLGFTKLFSDFLAIFGLSK